VTSGVNTSNYFADNQLTKFRVLIGLSKIFYPLPLKFPWNIAPHSSKDGLPWQTQQTNVS